MSRNIAALFSMICLAIVWPNGTAISQVPAAKQPAPIQKQPVSPQMPSELKKLQLGLKDLQITLSARDEAQAEIKRYLEIIAFTIGTMAFFGIFLQVLAFRLDASSRRQSHEDNAKQREREDVLNKNLMQVLNISSKATEDTQRKMESLQEGGLKRAADTLLLINNLLAITERSAAKAAGAQYEFLAKLVENFDSECNDLIRESTHEDERDIIAKPEHIERIRILTKQMESLDHQITTYNASNPREFATPLDENQVGTNVKLRTTSDRHQLSLTGRCLLIRGLNHHLDQNFSAAITDWKNSITAKGGSLVEFYSNYWIGYVNNTLGKFNEATAFIKASGVVAPDQKKTELKRLALETRFFAFKLDDVSDDILKEGEDFYNALNRFEESKRAMSSFSTTMGNISMIKHIRATSNGSEFAFPEDSMSWFDEALNNETKSRWARFGKYQIMFLLTGRLDAEGQKEIKDVIRSVKNEYQNRQEDRSKVLSRITEYMCLLMLNDYDSERISVVTGSIENHASHVMARTIYSQFRKQNVSKSEFLAEFEFLIETKDLNGTFRMANAKKAKQD